MLPLLKKLKKYWGLIILSGLLLIISIGIIKPEFYFLGWDNFSSYLNLKSTFFNTLFDTWREHRGLGTPSDAEINDIFRQIFYLVASLVLPKQLLDQAYFVLMLWGGVIGMYALGRYISQRLHHRPPSQELFGFISAFFYLFNLNTMAVFYYPMIMFVNRFFMLPTLVLIILKLIDQPIKKKRTYFFYLALLLIGFGTHMVPTNFIVLCIMLGFGLLFLKNKLKAIATIGFVISLGMYWILPFTNYTLQKSNIVPQAPLFIDINEALLNKPKRYFSFENQAKLRPNFFDITFTQISNKQSLPLHELSVTSQQPMTRKILWVFPILYLSGVIYIIIFKRDRVLLWMAATTVTFLLLSMKEYSPLSYLYELMTTYIPLTNTIFRFGDTKFHALIAFSGSILSATLLVELFSLKLKIKNENILKKYLTTAAIISLLVSHLNVFGSYFNGNFIGFFMYNQIPSAYFQIAKVINDDPEMVRIVHLPLDEHAYWKPYSWGYFGSSFMHFMLNKPIFDRSFEPASEENTLIHQQIMDLTRHASFAPDEKLLEERAQDLLYLLKSLSVKYVIDDGTVSTQIKSRGVSFWGTFNQVDSQRLFEYLEKNNEIKLVESYQIDTNSLQAAYSHLYPYLEPEPSSQPIDSIKLYEITNYQPRIRLISELEKVNTVNSSLSPSINRNIAQDYIQTVKFDDQSLIYPFTDKDSAIESNGDRLNIKLPIEINPGEYVFESPNKNDSKLTRLYQVFIKKELTNFQVYLQKVNYPNLIGSEYETSQQIFNLPNLRENYTHLKIGDLVLPLSDASNTNLVYLGSVVLRTENTNISLLYPGRKYNLSQQLQQLEPNPNCLSDDLGESNLQISGEDETLIINGQNVSGCFTGGISLDKNENTIFSTLGFKVNASIQSLAEKKVLDLGKPALENYLYEQNNPLRVEVCVWQEGINECLNKDKLFDLKTESTSFQTSISGNTPEIKRLFINYIVRNEQPQKYQANISDIELQSYISDKEFSINLAQQPLSPQKFSVNHAQPLSLLIPQAKSIYTDQSHANVQDMNIRYNPDCNDLDKDQLIKKTDQGLLLHVAACTNFLEKNINFDSRNFYLWQISYKHLAGNLPILLLNDNQKTYLYHKLTPSTVSANNYFNIPFQNPESNLLSNQEIEDKIDETNSNYLHGFINPAPDFQDQTDKKLIIQFHSPNFGLAEFNDISLTELPNYWPDSLIRPSNYQSLIFKNQIQLTSSKRILPSLWKIEVSSADDETGAILFNEQFDYQWKLIGVKTELQARCNGIANCYIANFKKGSNTIYLFYYPELLSLIGTLLSLLTIKIGWSFYKRKTPTLKQKTKDHLRGK